MLDEAKDDPIKKAALIREIVKSISLIPNIIKREVYVTETSKLLQIREEVLFKELAQLQKTGDKYHENSNDNFSEGKSKNKPKRY